MLIGLKVSFLTCKCVFYRPEHYTKMGAYKIEFLTYGNAKMKRFTG